MGRAKDHTTFRTLDREKRFRDPGNKTHYPELLNLTAPHVESFNAIFEGHGKIPSLLALAVADIPAVMVRNKLPPTDQDIKDHIKRAASSTKQELSNDLVYDSDDPADKKAILASLRGDALKVWIEEVSVAKPAVHVAEANVANHFTYPSECRERSTTYGGRAVAKVCWSVNDGDVAHEYRPIGTFPVMLRSNRCNLYGLGPQALVSHKEESEEMGGYFIVNGKEKLVRLLIEPRRNHVFAISRPTFANRGPAFTPYGVSIRCVRPDQTSSTVTLHYVEDGQLSLRFYWRKQEYLVPVMFFLKALIDVSDKEIFLAIMQGDFDNTYLSDRVELLLRNFRRHNMHTREQCLSYLGEKFRVVLDLPNEMTNAEVGTELIRRNILVHLTSRHDKFNMLIFMIQKLYALVAGQCAPDNMDAPNNQELLLPGHLYLAILKERLGGCLDSVRYQVMADLRRGRKVNFSDHKYVTRMLARSVSDIGERLNHFLSTGNLVSRSGLDQLQSSGYVIMAERINFLRYLAHFRCVHRGAFFQTMKTTSVRKLLPEAWGFLCPVHTPDGEPCGLLNHLSHACKVITMPVDTRKLPSLLASLGVSQAIQHHISNPTNVTVQLDGRIVGYCSPSLAADVARKLRYWKVTRTHGVPPELEIGYVPVSHAGQYPGLYLFTTAARMMRPVRYLPAQGEMELVGSFEQVYLEIACLDEDVVTNVTTHQEFAPTHILSVLANMTPFSDFNQSPRNMYQCQMGKQSMGTPTQALACRVDNKMYRLQSGQAPIAQAKLHQTYGFDEYPNGVNACVAVISYTGYDMEDAMILNKSAHERGFGYGTVYKSLTVDLSGDKLRRSHNLVSDTHQYFGLGNKATDAQLRETLDVDGLPYIGARLNKGDPLYAFVDESTGRTVIKRYKDSEEIIIDTVRVLGCSATKTDIQAVSITFRVPRAPVIGDKFSSRHGQKGVCSQKWPAVDMPFSESGVQPDVIINPHAFPSRMTIGMFVESLAAKAGALHGHTQDSTPFQFSEDYTAADYFGHQLLQAGYNYHGNEAMYSGITGQEFEADIYFGVVYYQRLRHMVNDKFQVRSTGPINPLTRQPVKGRKNAGGIRFGEMERDSLIAHGAAFLLQDRLLNCSDYCQTHICRICGSLTSPLTVPQKYTSRHVHQNHAAQRLTVECKNCNSPDGITTVAVPFVLRYLASELASMNIRIAFDVSATV
ncbi:hypothetical protein H4R35_006275 [Dimargaris xerosporica]|nr:hypothetical protein H4R35_006275 [Dimargaris xerosporica]